MRGADAHRLPVSVQGIQFLDHLRRKRAYADESTCARETRPGALRQGGEDFRLCRVPREGRVKRIPAGAAPSTGGSADLATRWAGIIQPIAPQCARRIASGAPPSPSHALAHGERRPALPGEHRGVRGGGRHKAVLGPLQISDEVARAYSSGATVGIPAGEHQDGVTKVGLPLQPHR
jgi:hypothetical protein